MICSDDQMFDFYIDNADTLIHFDIPDDKRTFSIRFSVFQSSNTMFEVSYLNINIYIKCNTLYIFIHIRKFVINLYFC